MFHHRDRIFEDPGVGRHLRTAEYILETGQVPRADPLSFTRAGAPWTDFEWAYEATVGELYRAGGLPLVCAFCYAIFAATVLGIYRTLLQSGFSLSTVLIVTMVAGPDPPDSLFGAAGSLHVSLFRTGRRGLEPPIRAAPARVDLPARDFRRVGESPCRMDGRAGLSRAGDGGPGDRPHDEGRGRRRSAADSVAGADRPLRRGHLDQPMGLGTLS